MTHPRAHHPPAELAQRRHLRRVIERLERQLRRERRWHDDAAGRGSLRAEVHALAIADLTARLEAARAELRRLDG